MPQYTSIFKKVIHKILHFVISTKKNRILGGEVKNRKRLNYVNHDMSPLKEIGRCPLCSSTSYQTMQYYDINTLIQEWISQFRMNPVSETYQNAVLEKRKCTHCEGIFFNYRLDDTERMYEELAKMAGYYPRERWDFDAAIELIHQFKPNEILEVGCGNGYFLDKIINLSSIILGTELNSQARSVCISKGLNVISERLDKIKGKFDMICSFQVLEHLEKPTEFIGQCLNLLNKHGKLIFSTPNPEGVLKVIGGILEIPPHHQFDFSYKAYEYIAKIFNLRIVAYQVQPLTFDEYYAYIQKSHEYEGKILEKDFIIYLYNSEKPNLSGHTHIICFEKSE